MGLVELPESASKLEEVEYVLFWESQKKYLFKNLYINIINK